MYKFQKDHPEERCLIFTSYPTDCKPNYDKIEQQHNIRIPYFSRQVFNQQALDEYDQTIPQGIIAEVYNLKPTIIFLDEYHYGGQTNISQNVLSKFKCKLVYISGTAFKLIDQLKLNYITISKENYQEINYPQVQITFINNNIYRQLHTKTRTIQKSQINKLYKTYELDKQLNNTFTFLETDGDNKAQQQNIKLDNIFCETHKVGGTFPNLHNIVILNNNQDELLIQQMFRLMNTSDKKKNIYISEFSQIICIIRYFQRMFNINAHIKDFDQILPSHITFSDNITSEFISQYLLELPIKITCYTNENAAQLNENFKQLFIEAHFIKAHKNLDKQNREKIQKDMITFQDKASQGESLSVYQLLTERIFIFVALNATNKIINIKYNDYSLKQMYESLENKLKYQLQCILNTCFCIKFQQDLEPMESETQEQYNKRFKVVFEQANYKINIICDFFDKNNSTQAVYNFYEIQELLIQSVNKEVYYDKMKHYICSTTNFEKNNNAEILTPIQTAQEMIIAGSKYLDCLNLSKDLFVQRYNQLPKIIEPCCGKGVFIACLYEQLLRLNYTKQEILEKILFFNDLNPFNIQICSDLLDHQKVFNLQYSNEDALKMDFSFYDLVITNPPYNGEKKEGRSNCKPMFIEFYEAFKTSKYQLILIPSKVFTISKYNINKLDLYSKLIYKFDIDDAKIFNDKSIKPRAKVVEIFVSYLILDRYVLAQPQYEDIIYPLEEILYSDENYITSSYFNIASNDKRLHSDQQENDIICYVSTKQNKEYKMFINKDCITKDYNFYKVVCISICRKDIHWELVLPNQVCNSSYFGFKCETLEQANKYKQLCEAQSSKLLYRKKSPNLGIDGLKQILNAKYYNPNEIQQ